MLRLRYATAVLLALHLLALGWIGGYFFYRTIFRGARPVSKDSVVIEVIAAYPGASAEEVERQVTIPLEVTLAGMPGLQSVRSRSLPGACGVYARFDSRTPYDTARQEVINRLQFTQPLPAGWPVRCRRPCAAFPGSSTRRRTAAVVRHTSNSGSTRRSAGAGG